MNETIQIALSGAAGRISYSLLFRIASGALFGMDQPVALSLLEVPEAKPLLDATMMELDDCPYPLLRSVRASTDATEAFAGADWVILIGGATYQPGMNRTDAVRANGPIFQAQGRAINDSAKNARVLVVANPCNTNCLIARTQARDVPPGHWFAMMRLDSNRGRRMLATKANVTIDRVTRVTAWGNHSPSVYVDCRNAWIGDQPALEVIDDPGWVRDVFEPGVAGRARKLHDLRGASPAGSGAQAIIGSIRALTTPTPYEHWFNAAMASDGSYGVPHGLIFGFPLRTEDGHTYSVVTSHYLDDHAQARIRENIAELEHDAAVAADFLAARPH
jgi:malate dehydrogenase